MARRVHEVAGWHTELYIDSKELNDLAPSLISLPAVSIDHLGLSKDGLKTLVRLAERGIKVKATGFGRVDFDVKESLRTFYAANPHCPMFGTDLPSTRAKRPFNDIDIDLVIDALGEEGASHVLYKNALDFYNPEYPSLEIRYKLDFE